MIECYLFCSAINNIVSFTLIISIHSICSISMFIYSSLEPEITWFKIQLGSSLTSLWYHIINY